MSPSLQMKLLRVLPERTFEPVGSSRTQKVYVRVIAATHRDLPAMIESGGFRDDLLYRLNVLPVEVPPLRERIEDLPLLVHHFLDRARAERGSRVEGMTDEALQQLMDYHWPGNVRELENVTERLTILVGEGDIEVEDLPSQMRAQPLAQTLAPRVPSSGLDFNAVVGRFETELIEPALDHTHWNKNRAAGLLSLNRTTLIEKIKKRGIRPPERPDRSSARPCRSNARVCGLHRFATQKTANRRAFDGSARPSRSRIDDLHALRPRSPPSAIRASRRQASRIVALSEPSPSRAARPHDAPRLSLENATRIGTARASSGV